MEKEDGLRYRGKNINEQIQPINSNKNSSEKNTISHKYSNPKIFQSANERKFLPIFTYLPIFINIIIRIIQEKHLIVNILISILIDIVIGMIIPLMLFPGDCRFIYELYFTFLRYIDEAKKRLPITIIITVIIHYVK